MSKQDHDDLKSTATIPRVYNKKKHAKKKEAVHHPDHYGGDTVYEVKKVIRAWGLSFNLGTAAKYIGRAGKKDPNKIVEDLEKAVWYLQDEIRFLKDGTP